MQGGIRRKRDLLPRYKNGAGTKRKNGYLTTPMKKILIYCSVLLGFFLLFRFAYSDLNKESEYELDQEATSSVERLNAAAAVAAAVSSQDKEKEEMEKVGASGAQFNNEVALQQEVENLVKEYKPDGAAGVAAPGAGNIAAGDVHGVPAAAGQKDFGKAMKGPQQLMQQQQQQQQQQPQAGAAQGPGGAAGAGAGAGAGVVADSGAKFPKKA
ncbi:hypothetical protein ZYGM_004980 [Zygosaccharomyces mellis]|uniref:Uncharacterized protein n=1 Tax=Zygosaccharomyces mellis TaxID=42258 RepID=A0A4C2E0H6_9SACH|nr:hypothetical protein ZYGM_004980 [Zygosaccharomyces mellis]